MSGRKKLVFGGEFIANVSRGNARRGACGNYGVGKMNKPERALIDTCKVRNTLARPIGFVCAHESWAGIL